MQIAGFLMRRLNLFYSIDLQDRSNSYDTMKFTNFENQLLDIMRSTNNMTIDPTEQLKGRIYDKEKKISEIKIFTATPYSP